MFRMAQNSHGVAVAASREQGSHAGTRRAERAQQAGNAKRKIKQEKPTRNNTKKGQEGRTGRGLVGERRGGGAGIDDGRALRVAVNVGVVDGRLVRELHSSTTAFCLEFTAVHCLGLEHKSACACCRRATSHAACKQLGDATVQSSAHAGGVKSARPPLRQGRRGAANRRAPHHKTARKIEHN